MSLRGPLSLSLLLPFSFSVLLAQDFDADSVFYTPIPKTYGLSKKEMRQRKLTVRDTTSRRATAYFFAAQSGVLAGCVGCGDISTTFSVVNGLTLGKKIRAGIGLGLDSYSGWQVLPAFGSLTWDIFETKDANALFFQFAYGGSKAWSNEAHQDFGLARVEGRRMRTSQVGVRLRYHDATISLALGLKFQRAFLHYEYATSYSVDSIYMPTTNKSRVQEDMRKLMVTMSIGWR